MREAVPLNEEGIRTSQVSIDERNIGSFLLRSGKGRVSETCSRRARSPHRTESRSDLSIESAAEAVKRKHQSAAPRLVRLPVVRVERCVMNVFPHTANHRKERIAYESSIAKKSS